ncbi:MAG: zf-TFIIB domain-containing protein [Dehalococcoidia bacterium]
MKCPKQHDELREVDAGPARIDLCPTCQGSWYDVGELRVLKDKESAGDYRWIHVDLWKDPWAFRTSEQRGLLCPRDGATLTTLRYGETSVSVDACGDCHGIWLEKNEYDEIVAELEKRVNTETLREYASDLQEEFLEVFAGPKGTLSELKDIDRVLYLMQLRFATEHPGIASVLRSLRL